MKDKIKKILTCEIKGIPHEYQWAAFLLPVFLLAVAFASWKVHPIGQTSLLTCDLHHQYAPILSEIRNKILTGESLFYTWNMGLGSNFWPMLTYNGASPLNVILLFFPQSHIADGITLMILLRTGLSGLFFSLLLYKKDGKTGAVPLALSTAYALCGYVLSYFWVLMWMDAVVLLPLAVLGLWKILCGEKPRLYIVALFLIVLSNFYTGFFVCLFLILFAPVLYLEARQKGVCSIHPVMAGLRFAFYSILSVGMTAVFILPTILSLKSTAAATDTITMTTDLSYKLFDFFSRFLLHADPVIREGLPNVYCGVAILILVPLYALCRSISFSQRAVSLALVAVLYLSMNSPVLNFLWHGTHITNQLPYRQSFLLCFLLIYLAAQVLMHADGLQRNVVFLTGAAVLCYLVILEKTGDASKNYWLTYGSAAFVIAYTTILSFFSDTEKGRGRAHKCFLYAIILELFFASEFALQYIEKTEHLGYYPSYGQHAQAIADDLSDRDGDRFSRAVLFQPITGTGNDGALYHVKTVSIFASTTPESIVKFLGGLGFANNQLYEVKEEGITEVSARLLGIRYTVNFTGGVSGQESSMSGKTDASTAVLGADTTIDQPKADIVYSGYEIIENDQVLPLGFYVSSIDMKMPIDPALSPFEKTNELLINMGTQAVYKEGTLSQISGMNISESPDTDAYSIVTSGQAASLTLSPDGFVSGSNVLMYVGTEQKMSIRVSQSNRHTGKTSILLLTPQPGQIIDCGLFPASEDGEMKIQVVFLEPTSEMIPISAYYIDDAALDAATETLASQPFRVTSYDATHVTGTVDFTQSGYLFTSIPYDTGWTVKIDGKTVITQKAYGALLSVPVSAGSHQITFSYIPPGFVPGLVITILLVVDFVFLYVWDPMAFVSRLRKKRREATQTEEEEA